MTVAMEICESTHIYPEKIRNINTDQIDDKFLTACLRDVKDIFETQHGEGDKIAKSDGFTKDLTQHLNTKFSTSKPKQSDKAPE